MKEGDVPAPQLANNCDATHSHTHTLPFTPTRTHLHTLLLSVLGLRALFLLGKPKITYYTLLYLTLSYSLSHSLYLSLPLTLSLSLTLSYSLSLTLSLSLSFRDMQTCMHTHSDTQLNIDIYSHSRTSQK